MADGPSSDVKLEIGHVLFIDIVGYSKLLINEQSEQIQKLREIVRGTEQARLAEAEGKLLRLPTGDGGALVFRTSPEAPVLCALEISKELKNHPELRVRMGIHSGPVNEVTDLNEQANIAGVGINIAQRVMDCGDAGHILISRRVAEDLEHYSQWRRLLHDLGEVEVKHGMRIHIFSLHTEELGNPALPEKLRLAREREEQTARANLVPAVRGERRPFVGRTQERIALDQMLEKTTQGRGGLVLLGGEPGVGKTRLAVEILEDARDRGMLAFEGHAYEEESGPWVTAREILEEMVRRLPAGELRQMLGENASELSRLLPELRRIFSDISEPEELPPQQQQRFLFKSVLEFLTRASRATPMVMLLDDIHWADESSMLLLEHVAPRLSELPILMVGTYRDVESEMGKPFAKTMTTLVRQRLTERIAVKQFSESSVAELLAALGGAKAPGPLVRAIYDETEGNAFFVEEVFRHLSEEGLLFDAEGRWRSDLDVRSLDVPEGVRLVTARRLERLQEATVKMLTAAAGIGLRFELRILEALSTDPETVLDYAEEAEAAQLIKPTAGSREARYEFSHALVRQTLLSALSAARLQRLHLRIADAMEEVFGEHVGEHAAELAHQLDAAGAAAAAGRTRRFLRLAGDQARAAAAMEEAFAFYEKALALTEGIEPVERGEILFRRGLTHRALGRLPEEAADWQEALPALESAGEKDLAMQICWELAYQATWQVQHKEAKFFATRGLASAGDRPSAGRARLLAVLGHAHFEEAEFEQAEELFEEANAIVAQLGDEKLLGGEVLLHQLYYCVHTANAGKMAAISERAIALARQSGRPWDLASVLGLSSWAWCLRGQFDRARNLANEAEPLAIQEGDFGTVANVGATRGFVGLAAADFVSGRAGLEKVVRMLKEIGFPWSSVGEAWLGLLEMAQGDWPSARRDLEEGASCHVHGSMRGMEESHLLLFKTYARDPDATELLVRLSAQLPRAGVTNGAGAWSMLLASIESGALLGRHEQAAALYPLVPELMAQGTVVMFCQGLVEKFAGIAAAAGRSWPVAESHFKNALRQAEEIPHWPEQAEVRRWYARMLIDRDQPGDREQARTLLTEARAGYEKIGMPKHVQMVDELLRDSPKDPDADTG